MTNPTKPFAGAGFALGAFCLALAAAVSGAPLGVAAPSGSPATGPPPDAPHAGTVAGARTGAHLSVNTPQNIHAFLELHGEMLGARWTPPSLPATIHEYVGTSFDNIPNSTGAQAVQSVSTRIKPADPGTTLYTPTMFPSGGSCIEVSTAYFHTSQVVAAWDWCVDIRFDAEVTIDASFLATYAVNHNYAVQIAQTDPSTNEWTAYLYNYVTGQWETFFTRAGTSQVGLAEGWDLYELYTNLKPNGQSYACVDLKNRRVQSQDIQVRIGSTWQVADPSVAGDDYDVPLDQFHCKSLRYRMITQFSNWKAVG